MHPFTIIEADLGSADHQEAILSMVDLYAQDPMGGGRPLAPAARENLIAGLRGHPTTVVFLAFAGAEPAGVAVCFRGFSTFAARPLLNIHDLAVRPGMRGRGIGKALLAAVEAKAKALGCCKLTLEVLERNQRAREVYHAFGFDPGQSGANAGGTFFYTKPLA
jgi:GNAT superfamily N-acetyltransferase